MFGHRNRTNPSSSQSQYTRMKETQREVNIYDRDLELFRVLNGDNPRIREEAENLKNNHAELREYPPEVAIIIHTKSQYLASIKRYMNNAITAGNVLSLASETVNSYKWIIDTLKEYVPDVSRFILDYIEPDYSLQDPSRYKGNKLLVVSNNKPRNISAILQAFQVPEGIAGDLQEIYTKGTLYDPVSISMLINIAETYFKKTKKKTDASAYEFAP